jgi:hypothetical protein
MFLHFLQSAATHVHDTDDNACAVLPVYDTIFYLD